MGKLNGIYVNDIPVDLFMKYFNESNVDNIEYEPILEDLKIRGYIFSNSDSSFSSPYQNLTIDNYEMFLDRSIFSDDGSIIVNMDNFNQVTKSLMQSKKGNTVLPESIVPNSTDNMIEFDVKADSDIFISSEEGSKYNVKVNTEYIVENFEGNEYEFEVAVDSKIKIENKATSGNHISYINIEYDGETVYSMPYPSVRVESYKEIENSVIESNYTKNNYYAFECIPDGENSYNIAKPLYNRLDLLGNMKSSLIESYKPSTIPSVYITRTVTRIKNRMFGFGFGIYSVVKFNIPRGKYYLAKYEWNNGTLEKNFYEVRPGDFIMAGNVYYEKRYLAPATLNGKYIECSGGYRINTSRQEENNGKFLFGNGNLIRIKTNMDVTDYLGKYVYEYTRRKVFTSGPYLYSNDVNSENYEIYDTFPTIEDPNHHTFYRYKNTVFNNVPSNYIFTKQDDDNYIVVENGDVYDKETVYYTPLDANKKKVFFSFDSSSINTISTYYIGLKLKKTYNKEATNIEEYYKYIPVKSVLIFLTENDRTELETAKLNNTIVYTKFKDFNVYDYENFYYIEFNKSTRQKVNDDGEGLYYDKYGFETTEAFVESNFKRHNRAIRKSFYGLIDPSSSIIYKFGTYNKLGVVQKGNKYIPAYYEYYKHSLNYTRIPNGVPSNPSVGAVYFDTETNQLKRCTSVSPFESEVVTSTATIVPPKFKKRWNRTEISYIKNPIMLDESILDFPRYNAYARGTRDLRISSMKRDFYIDTDVDNISLLFDLSYENKGILLDCYDRYLSFLGGYEKYLNIDNKLEAVLTNVGLSTTDVNNNKVYYDSRVNSQLKKYTVNDVSTSPYILLPIRFTNWNEHNMVTFTLFISRENETTSYTSNGYKAFGALFNDGSNVTCKIAGKDFEVFTPEEIGLETSTDNLYYIKFTFTLRKNFKGTVLVSKNSIGDYSTQREKFLIKSDTIDNKLKSGFILYNGNVVYQTSTTTFTSDFFQPNYKYLLESGKLVDSSYSGNKVYIPAPESDLHIISMTNYKLPNIEYKGVRQYLSMQANDNGSKFDPYISVEYIQDAYDYTKYYVKTEKYENIFLNLVSSADTYYINNINTNNVFSKEELIRKFSSNRLLVVDGSITLRGNAVPEDVYYQNKKSAIKNMLTDLLSNDSKDFVETSTMYLDSDPYNKMRVYSNAFKVLIENDQNLLLNKTLDLKKVLNDIEDVYYRVIIEYGEDKSEKNIKLNNQDVMLDYAAYKEKFNTPFARLLNYEKFPTNEHFEKYMKPIVKQNTVLKEIDSNEKFNNTLPYYYDKDGNFKYGYDNTVIVREKQLSDIKDNIIKSITGLYEDSALLFHRDDFIRFYTEKLENYEDYSKLNPDTDEITEKKVFSSSISDIDTLIDNLSTDKDKDKKEWRIL